VSTSNLADFAANGLSAVSLAGLPALAKACRSECIETGDARFCVIAEALRAIDDWQRAHDDGGGTPVALIDQIDAVIKDRLASVLAARDPSQGAKGADEFRQEIENLLLGPADWLDAGYAREP
jgi:hypothetical protein